LTRMTPEYAAALLGLGPDASHEQVNRAWRVWAKLAHPDIGGDRGHFEALASARAVLLSAVDSPSERTTPPASSSAPRVALRSVTRRPRGAVLLALALATGAAFVLALSIPDLPEPTAALVVGSIAGSAAWVLHRSLLLPSADTGHRICALSACWFPLAAALTSIAAVNGMSVVAFLPLIVLPFVVAVALINPGAGLSRPSRLQT
jgi:hypothetical protein